MSCSLCHGMPDCPNECEPRRPRSVCPYCLEVGSHAEGCPDEDVPDAEPDYDTEPTEDDHAI